jgi:hypothetical protein
MLVDVDGLAEALRPAVKAALARAIALELVELVEHGGRAEALGTGAPPAETGGAKELSVSITKGSPSVGAIPSVAPKPLRAQRAQQPPPRPSKGKSRPPSEWIELRRQVAARAEALGGPRRGPRTRTGRTRKELEQWLRDHPAPPPWHRPRLPRRRWSPRPPRFAPALPPPAMAPLQPGRGACGKATAGSPMRSVPVWSAVRRRHTTGRGACSMRPPIASAAPRRAAPSACRTL